MKKFVREKLILYQKHCAGKHLVDLRVVRMSVKMSLDEKFMKAAEDVKRLKKKPSEDEMLKIYGLYKQGLIGDCNTEKPGSLDFRRLAMWKAWNAEKGLSKNEAKEKYIETAEQLIRKYDIE